MFYLNPSAVKKDDPFETQVEVLFSSDIMAFGNLELKPINPMAPPEPHLEEQLKVLAQSHPDVKLCSTLNGNDPKQQAKTMKETIQKRFAAKLTWTDSNSNTQKIMYDRNRPAEWKMIEDAFSSAARALGVTTDRLNSKFPGCQRVREMFREELAEYYHPDFYDSVEATFISVNESAAFLLDLFCLFGIGKAYSFLNAAKIFDDSFEGLIAFIKCGQPPDMNFVKFMQIFQKKLQELANVNHPPKSADGRFTKADNIPDDEMGVPQKFDIRTYPPLVMWLYNKILKRATGKSRREEIRDKIDGRTLFCLPNSYGTGWDLRQQNQYPSYPYNSLISPDNTAFFQHKGYWKGREGMQKDKGGFQANREFSPRQQQYDHQGRQTENNQRGGRNDGGRWRSHSQFGSDEEIVKETYRHWGEGKQRDKRD
uniref:Uncharacterized protein n=1 Tax=Chromera velia CCMP2878 TaxID=1169474 RepID=A0A0G4G0E4_9ALVE|eukprot:Cvel_19618.t1-p1 / transcript=Cvel_19618.t1 / gene=Cvel_19618 / organism=Chromera_velia_CCMP2878 / gene_product=hypothetical protein / transcript_product=hypothetical protein / location=Cvel_scaffold1706:30927-32423(+) / protein_length=424 / sequence_SO=supercontig / SO=protein_coding / is_pseudo=false